MFLIFAAPMLRIGKIVATHGLNGSLIMTHIVGHSKWLKKDDVLFVEMNKGSQIPYFLTQVKASGQDEYTVNVEDIATVEAARRLVGKSVYVKEDILAKHAQDSPLLWIGFKVTDQVHGELGAIEDIMQSPGQWLAKLTYKGKEVLLPLIEETVKQIDLQRKIIKMDLPEGLLEVYLG